MLSYEHADADYTSHKCINQLTEDATCGDTLNKCCTCENVNIIHGRCRQQNVLIRHILLRTAGNAQVWTILLRTQAPCPKQHIQADNPLIIKEATWACVLSRPVASVYMHSSSLVQNATEDIRSRYHYWNDRLQHVCVVLLSGVGDISQGTLLKQ